MIGCIARAKGEMLVIDPTEMEDVRWVDLAGGRRPSLNLWRARTPLRLHALPLLGCAGAASVLGSQQAGLGAAGVA